MKIILRLFTCSVLCIVLSNNIFFRNSEFSILHDWINEVSHFELMLLSKSASISQIQIWNLILQVCSVLEERVAVEGGRALRSQIISCSRVTLKCFSLQIGASTQVHYLSAIFTRRVDT